MALRSESVFVKVGSQVMKRSQLTPCRGVTAEVTLSEEAGSGSIEVVEVPRVLVAGFQEVLRQ